MPKRKRSHPVRKTFPAILLFVSILVGFLSWLVLWPSGPTTETFVEIPVHTGTLGVGNALQAGGVIRSKWAFDLLREVEGGTLKAGEYRFDHPASLLAVYDRLRRGDVYTIAVTIPEGYNVFDIAQTIQGAGLVPAGTFLKAAQAAVPLVRSWDPQAQSVEGYLFPDTYRFSRNTTPAVMLQSMIRRFQQMSLRLGLTRAQTHRVVTLASLVEREVHADAERPIVAGVFENRLRLGMPLQTDPTVVYASILRGTWNGVIHQSELHSDSSYNTYTHAGLPPGPICNPGIAALQAAMHPATTEFLYFVANPDGSTRFAKSLREHGANVALYRGAQGRTP